MHRTGLAILLGFFLHHLNAQSVYTYVGDVNGAVGSTAPNMSATILSRVNNAAVSTACSTGFNLKNLTTGAFNESTTTAVEFTLTPASNYYLTLTTINANLRSENQAADSIRFAYRLGTTGPFTASSGQKITITNNSCGDVATQTWILPSAITFTPGTSLSFRIYFYQASSSNGAAQITQISVLGTITLPVELTNFSAKAGTDRQNILLDWTTASEYNSDYFALEKSGDGSHFTEIARIPSAGNSSFPINYNYVDQQPGLERNYYRLKQMDRNGSFVYSPIRSIDLQHAAMLEISPTLVTSTLKLSMQPRDADQFWYVFDAQGKVWLNGKLGQEASTATVDASALPAGCYFVRSSNGVSTEIKKFEKF